MKIKKLICLILCLIMTVSTISFCSCAISDTAAELNERFKFGKGPETNGYAIDYRYYSPVKKNDTTKYPLVIWLHGMMNGKSDGDQLEHCNISEWASKDYQKRFRGTKGAFIMAPRSLEEEGLYWSDELIYPLRRAIDKFISKNKKNIDVTRIYIGGYSMGGKMTLKMAVAYPEMFAAIFPVCPAWVPGEKASAQLKNTPMWLTSGVPDPLANYFAYVTPTWNNIVSSSKRPKDLRFSSLKMVCYDDGKICSSAHESWNAVTSDLFSAENGAYPYISTIDGNGEKVELKYPKGLIYWLSSYKSKYNGKAAKNSGNDAVQEEGHGTGLTFIKVLFSNLFSYIKNEIKEYREDNPNGLFVYSLQRKTNS